MGKSYAPSFTERIANISIGKFERNASDPNRFFEKGSRGSSVTRLEEAKNRSEIYKVY